MTRKKDKLEALIAAAMPGIKNHHDGQTLSEEDRQACQKLYDILEPNYCYGILNDDLIRVYDQVSRVIEQPDIPSAFQKALGEKKLGPVNQTDRMRLA